MLKFHPKYLRKEPSKNKGGYLEIAEGDITVIMGNSGPGKSTLKYLLSGMDKVTGGDVYLEGRKITSYSKSKMAEIRGEKSRSSSTFTIAHCNFTKESGD